LVTAALFFATGLSAQTITSCNPANCKKATKTASSGSATFNLVAATSNGAMSCNPANCKKKCANKPNCDPKACNKLKTGEARLVSNSVEEGKRYSTNPAAIATLKGSVTCNPALCKKICAGKPNCSPKDCAKAGAGKAATTVDEGTTKL